MSAELEWIERALERRLSEAGRSWYAEAKAEGAAGVSDLRFAGLLSVASRSCRAGDLAPSAEDRLAAYQLMKGWEPERWKSLEAARVGLILSRPDLEEEGVVSALETCFQHADESSHPCAM